MHSLPTSLASKCSPTSPAVQFTRPIKQKNILPYHGQLKNYILINDGRTFFDGYEFPAGSGRVQGNFLLFVLSIRREFHANLFFKSLSDNKIPDFRQFPAFFPCLKFNKQMFLPCFPITFSNEFAFFPPFLKRFCI